MNQVRAAGIAAFFLGIGLAGEPLDPIGALMAFVAVAILTVALERPGSALQTFVVGFFGVLLSSVLQHALPGGAVASALHPALVAQRLYFGLYPGSGVVAVGLGLLAASSLGRKNAPAAIAVIGTAVGIALFFLL